MLAGPFISNQIILVLFKGKFPSGLRFLLSLACNVTVGVLMTRLIEWPILGLRNKLFPGVSNAVSTSLQSKM